jgi:hypothetical protein
MGAISALERVAGIEPASQPWEGRILPVNYTRRFVLRLTETKKYAVVNKF